MATKPGSLTQQVVDRVNAQIAHDYPKVADWLKGEMLYGTSKMSASDYLALLHRNWADPTFRQGELQRLGPVAFNAAVTDMLKNNGLPPGALVNGMPWDPGVAMPMGGAMPGPHVPIVDKSPVVPASPIVAPSPAVPPSPVVAPSPVVSPSPIVGG